MKNFEMFKILQADAQVKALLDDRIFEDLAPRETKTPYLVWTEVSGTPENHLDCGANVDHLEIQVLIYDPYKVTARNIRTEVCRVLEKKHVIDARLGHYEADTKLWARGFSMNVWLNR